MKKKFWLGTLALAATLCCSVGIANVSYTASAEDAAVVVAEETTLDLLDGATFDNTNTKVQYDVATKTGKLDAASSTVNNKYFTHVTNEYCVTAEGKTKFEGFSAVYSVTFSNVSVVDTNNKLVGLLFESGTYTAKFGVGGAKLYGGYGIYALGSDTASPFVTDSQSGNKRPCTTDDTKLAATTVMTATITPKIGDTDGSIAFTVNGADAGTYVYEGTELPQVGIQVQSNTADISNASYKVVGATGWYVEPETTYDLFAYENAQHAVRSDGETAETKYSYDFANKVGYIGGNADGVLVGEKERATAYFTVDTPDKLIDENDEIIDYSAVKSATISMTFSNVVSADGAFDQTNNNEFVSIRLAEKVSGQKAGFWIFPAALYGHYGVIERSDNAIYASNFDTGSIRFGGSTNPWVDGSITISIKITPATDTEVGKIEVSLNGVVAQYNGKIGGTSTTIAECAYAGTTIPEFGMYSRGVSAKVSNVSYTLHGVKGVHEHTEETLAAVAATCTTDGLTEGKKCSVCEMVTVAQETIPAAHTLTKTDATAATCTEAGNIAYWTCSGECGKTYSDEACTTEVTDVVVAANGHNTTKTDAQAATCTEGGWIDFWFCNTCSKIYADAEYTTEITAEQALTSANGHNTTKTDAQAATCTEGGWIDFWFCNTCSKIYSDAEYTTEITAEQALTSANGHTEETLAAVAATCTETGLKEGKKCSVCKEVLVAQEEVAVLGHTEETLAAVAATCTETGLTEGKKCSVCEEVLVAQEEVAVLGHTEETLAAVAATCTETGLTEGKKCSVCEEVLVAQEEVAVLGHTESDWIIDSEAQVGEAGSKHKECTVCGETMVTEEIPALEDTTSEQSSEANESNEPSDTASDDGEQALATFGCGSAIGGLSIGVMLLGAGAVALLRKKEED